MSGPGDNRRFGPRAKAQGHRQNILAERHCADQTTLVNHTVGDSDDSNIPADIGHTGTRLARRNTDRSKGKVRNKHHLQHIRVRIRKAGPLRCPPRRREISVSYLNLAEQSVASTQKSARFGSELILE